MSKPHHPPRTVFGFGWTIYRCRCRRCNVHHRQVREILRSMIAWPANGGAALRRNANVLDAIAEIGMVDETTLSD